MRAVGTSIYMLNLDIRLMYFYTIRILVLGFIIIFFDWRCGVDQIRVTDELLSYIFRKTVECRYEYTKGVLS